MSYQVIFTDELYHHGVKGQRWGIRRYQNEDGLLTAAGKARYDVKEAKRDYKKARKEFNKSSRFAVGVNRLQKFSDARDKLREKEFDVIDKKAARAALKSEKKEFNTYRKAMQRSGIRNSSADDMSRQRSTDLYNRIATKKGKEYADRVEKKVQNTAIRNFAIGTSLAVGSAVASYYLSKDS